MSPNRCVPICGDFRINISSHHRGPLELRPRLSPDAPPTPFISLQATVRNVIFDERLIHSS